MIFSGPIKSYLFCTVLFFISANICWATNSFFVTNSTYTETQNHNQACQNEFGTKARLADWNDITAYYSAGGNMYSFFDTVGLPPAGSDGTRNLTVSRNGSEMYSSTRHYYITRHDHNLPSYYLAHANIDNYLLSLGSWTINGHALCYGQKYAPPAPVGKASVAPILNILLAGPNLLLTQDAYGNVVKIIAREKTGNCEVITTLVKRYDGTVEITSDILSTDGKMLRLEFLAQNPNLINGASKTDLAIKISNVASGYNIYIPKSLMPSWGNSSVKVSSYGKDIPSNALTVIDDDPRLFWNSTLMPNADYVIPVNSSTKEIGNKAVEALDGEGFFNEFFDNTVRLRYQAKYHVNYSAINANSRTIKVYASMSEDDGAFGDDPVERDFTPPITIVVNDISMHTSGVDYFVGPKGWYAVDSKTGQQFAGENSSDIGFFEFKWSPIDSLGVGWKDDAEFYASIQVNDGDLVEYYKGDLHWNFKIPYRRPSFIITTPTSGATLNPGSTQNIQWKTYYWDTGEHEISISYGDPVVNTVNYTLVARTPYIVQGEMSEGSYSWKVPTDPGDWRLALVRYNMEGLTFKAPETSTSITINEPPTCDANHLDLCTTQPTCEGAGGYWWTDEKCHDSKEVAPSGTAIYQGKMWQKNDDNIYRNWEEASTYCQGLYLGGYDDWRLPTKTELKSLVSCSNGHSTPLQDWDSSGTKPIEQNIIDATCCNNYPDCNNYDKPVFPSFITCTTMNHYNLWSSTTLGTYDAWRISCLNGLSSHYERTYTESTRCIRK
jgi:Protein of unknown function (DUF1566)